MKHIINSIVLIGFSVCGAQALADDSMTRATPTDEQMLKACIEKQKTADVTMSKEQMTRMCKDQLKQQKQNGTPMDPPPQDTPHN
jgi:carbonic anhydrase